MFQVPGRKLDSNSDNLSPENIVSNQLEQYDSDRCTRTVIYRSQPANGFAASWLDWAGSSLRRTRAKRFVGHGPTQNHLHYATVGKYVLEIMWIDNVAWQAQNKIMELNFEFLMLIFN